MAHAYMWHDSIWWSTSLSLTRQSNREREVTRSYTWHSSFTLLMWLNLVEYVSTWWSTSLSSIRQRSSERHSFIHVTWCIYTCTWLDVVEHKRIIIDKAEKQWERIDWFIPVTWLNSYTWHDSCIHVAWLNMEHWSTSSSLTRKRSSERDMTHSYM